MEPVKPLDNYGFMQNNAFQMIDKSKTFFRKLDIPGLGLFQHDADLEEKQTEYLWSRDPFYVKQYMKMVDDNYDNELHVSDTFKKIGSNDFRSHFFLSKIDKKVIMGVRLTLNDPFLKYSLPTEKNNFNFSDLFQDIDFANNKYCEITKFTVLEEHRNDINHYVNGFKFFKQLMDEHKIKYMLICGSRARHRIYKKFAAQHFNFVDMKKLDITLWPEYSTISFAHDSWASLYQNMDIT